MSPEYFSLITYHTDVGDITFQELMRIPLSTTHRHNYPIFHLWMGINGAPCSNTGYKNNGNDNNNNGLESLPTSSSKTHFYPPPPPPPPRWRVFPITSTYRVFPITSTRLIDIHNPPTMELFWGSRSDWGWSNTIQAAYTYKTRGWD